MGEQNSSGSKESLKLGKAIQLARQNASMTQQELCHHANLSYSTLAKIERGAIKTPSVFTVYRIALALNVDVDELLGSVAGSKAGRKKRTSKSGVSFVFFDVNGCLVRFFHGAFTRIASESGVSSDRIETAFWHYNDAVCRGDMSMDEFNTAFAKQAGLDTIDWSSYYLDAIEPITEMQDLVKWVSTHYKVGLLTNIMPDFISTMIDRGILPKIKYDAIVDSSEVKAIKPEPRMYEIAEQKAGVNAPSEILFVDDSRTNLMAAERQGWKVLWFDDFHSQDSADRVKSALEF